MSIDTTEIGIVAAKVMEDLDAMQQGGELEDDARVVAVLVTYEIRSTKEGSSTVGGRCTDNSNVLGLGLMARMQYIMTHPEED